MSFEQEILASLRAAYADKQTRIDPKQGQAWHLSLQKALGGHVEDASDYTSGRSYRFTRSITPQDASRFRSTLIVQLSTFGSFSTQCFIQGFKDEHWWSQAIRSSRGGFSPDDAAFLLKIRAWHGANGLREVEPRFLALLVPEDIPVPHRRDTQPTLFHALFGR